MIVRFAKSLDRPIDIFGLKGKWIKVFLVGVALILVVALVFGASAGSAYGIGSFLCLAIVWFFVCLVKQGKIPQRRLPRMGLSSRIYHQVTRRETIARILMRDPRIEDLGYKTYEGFSEALKKRREDLKSKIENK